MRTESREADPEHTRRQATRVAPVERCKRPRLVRSTTPVRTELLEVDPEHTRSYVSLPKAGHSKDTLTPALPQDETHWACCVLSSCVLAYRVTLLIRKCPFPRTTIGP